MICGEDHYTKDCPHHEEVNKFLKGASQPTVLTALFHLNNNKWFLKILLL